MNELIVPRTLKKGDTIAFISISGGRAGDPDMLRRYNLAKERFEKEYEVHVVETPNALKGNDFIYKHPELRAEDLHWALTNPEISGIVCNQGGDDSYRVLPYIDPEVIRSNPKVFMGFSDIATWIAVFTCAGVRSYYGPCVLTPIGQPVKFDDYSKEAIRKAIFTGEVIGEVKPSESYTKIEWNDDINPKEIKWIKNDGYSVVQGEGKVSGRLYPICPGPVLQIMGTKYFPPADTFDGAILAIEHGNGYPYDSALAGFHQMRTLAAAGVFDKAAAIMTGKMDDTSRNYLRKVINEEVHREDMVILENVDFVHRTPMTVLPTGVLCEIDCSGNKFSILEAGTRQ